ncbi:MAG: hypothetical protein WCQ32_00180 [bacterium]
MNMKYLLSVSAFSISIFAISFFAYPVYAGGGGISFGGRVMAMKAQAIEQQESSNYKCTVPGHTIRVKLVSGGLIDLAVPPGTRLNSKLHVGQQILGIYKKQSSQYTCIYQGYPPNTATVTIQDTVNYYGSR